MEAAKKFYLCDSTGSIHESEHYSRIVLMSAMRGVPPFASGQELYVRIMSDQAEVSLDAKSGYTAVKVIGISDAGDKCFVTVSKPLALFV